MQPIIFIDRETGQKQTERVFGQAALQLAYGNDFSSYYFGRYLNHLWSRNPLFSSLYGKWQNLSWTKRNIAPFIEKYNIDASEFAEEIGSFRSFNDFFTRHLKPSARPIASGKDVTVIPADGRYLFFPNIQESDGFLIKGKKFDLTTFLNSENLAKEYREGTMIISRLCPSDYHRFHFPCDCTPDAAELINGWLYSVNPVALRRDIDIFTQNKRALTVLNSQEFGKVLYLEVGATNVGSIIQTYIPHQFQPKGAEKGYFSFGASTLVLLFQPNTTKLDADLLEASKQGLEIKCLLGQSMGTKI